MARSAIEYRAPGPVAAAYLVDRSPVSAIMGPIGGGKTSASYMKHVQAAFQMPRSPIDGHRRYRFPVIRDTIRQLEKTAIPSWLEWFPRDLGEFVGGRGGVPASHSLAFDLGLNGKVLLEVQFFGLGEAKIEDVMRGWEGSGGHLNEADRLPEEVLIFLRGRVGRYPSAKHGGCPNPIITLDYNSPDDSNWTYRLFEEDRPEGFAFFRQPSGLSPNAENLENLPEGYYQRQMTGQPDWYVRRMIKNDYGYSRDGEPVFAEDYNDDWHVAKRRLDPVPDIPLELGGDAGRTPAMTVGQMMPSGQRRILGELCGKSMGAETFGKEINYFLKEEFAGCRVDTAGGDPQASYAGDQDERAWLEIVSAVTGIKWRPAPTNLLTPRLEAVRGELREAIDGQPALLISPACKMIRKAFNSRYRFKQVMVQGSGGTVRYEDKPDKNEASHPMDALQYEILTSGTHYEVGERKRERSHAAGKVFRAQGTGFSVFGGRR